MSLWEYKVITSGRGGFATPALLEKFLNDLGKEEWEIIEFRTQPDNALAFSGLARRTTQRDWTLEDAAAAAARNEAEKLRAEFEAKFKGMGAGRSAGETAAPEDEEKPATTDDFRHVRDTSSDQDPDAPDDEPKDEWDQLTEENELPTFFEAIRPHLRRNQRGPGMSAGIEHLCKRWNLTEEDLKGALLECGFAIPEDEDDKPVYLEYEGDLYWLNVNRRGELWINTKEKPRPVFRTVAGQRVTPEATDTGAEGAKAGNGEAPANGGTAEPETPATAPEPLPEGPALLEKIRPMMRRNRRGPGISGSGSFLSRALRCKEADLATAFAALGLVEAGPDGKPSEVELIGEVWWVNRDSRGGLWINGRRKSDAAENAAPDAPAPAEGAPASEAPVGEASAAPAPDAGDAPAVSALSPGSAALLAGARPHLSETKPGVHGAELCALAAMLGRPPEDLLKDLITAGLKSPEKPRERSVYVDHAGEAFWLSRNAEDEIWLNAKVAKSAEGGERRGARRGRGRKSDE
jgi:hypothetical protein